MEGPSHGSSSNINKFNYATVKFVKSNGVAAVPLSWISQDENVEYCVWPKTNVTCRSGLIRQLPGKDWPRYEVEVLQRFETYDEALQLEIKEGKTSDSEPEKGRGKRKIKRKIFSDGMSPPHLSESGKSESELMAANTPKQARKESYGKYYKVNKDNISKELYDKIIENFLSSDGPTDAIIEDDAGAQKFVSTADTRRSITGTSTSSDSDVADVMSNEENTTNSVATREETPAETDNTDNSVPVAVEAVASTKFEQYVVQRLTSMEATINLLYNKLSNEQTVMEVVVPSEDRLPQLPCDSIDALLELENLLETDKVIFSQFETKLRLIGGHSYKNCIYRCLKTIFSNALSARCSLKGKKNNFAVDGLQVMNVLFNTILKSYTITKAQFEGTVMDWFKHGHQRLLKEKKDIN